MTSIPIREHTHGQTILKAHSKSIGFGYLWTLQDEQNLNINLAEIKQRISDIHTQQCIESCGNSNKGRNYIALKKGWHQENYLQLLDDKDSLIILKYRTGNHKLPIETGRYYDIDYHDRICPHCNADIGDEYHYLLVCSKFDNLRKKYITKNIIKHPNMLYYTQLMNTTDIKTLKKICNFVKIIMNEIK